MGGPSGDNDEPGTMLSWPTTRDPDAEALCRQVAALGQSALSEMGVAAARVYLEGRSGAPPAGPVLGSVRDDKVTVGEDCVPVRVYRASVDSSRGRPLVVYFHGGGWVIGSVGASDAFCRRLSAAADCVVVSVGYPLAPERRFPAAIDAAVAAIDWAARGAGQWGGDPDRLVVMGDSAGGNIATVAVRRLVQAGRRLVARQVLAYPGTTADRGGSPSPFASQWPLTDADRVWFIDQYVPDPADRSHPDVAPLLADLAGMPATTVLLGGCDPLFGEGQAYADRLWRAGVSVDLHVYSGQIHGFLTLDPTILPRSGEALGLVANTIRNL